MTDVVSLMAEMGPHELTVSSVKYTDCPKTGLLVECSCSEG